MREIRAGKTDRAARLNHEWNEIAGGPGNRDPPTLGGANHHGAGMASQQHQIERDRGNQKEVLRKNSPREFPAKPEDVHPPSSSAGAVLNHDQSIALEAELVSTEAKDMAAKQLARLVAPKTAKAAMKTAKPAAPAVVTPAPAPVAIETQGQLRDGVRASDLETRFFFGAGTTKPIYRATDLINYLPHDKRHHYRDGYSMAEAAKCWLAANGRLPPAIAALVGTDILETAHFEYEITVWGRGTSMTDIMAFAPEHPLAIEAKAREAFDDEVRNWVYKEEAENPRSPPHRLRVIDKYAEAFGASADALMELRYQLLHRTRAAALMARQCRRKSAWMIVHSFAPLECEEHARNRADFNRYVSLVGETPAFKGVPVRLAWVDEII